MRKIALILPLLLTTSCQYLPVILPFIEEAEEFAIEEEIDRLHLEDKICKKKG